MNDKITRYTFDDPVELNKLIKTIESVAVVESCKE